ncbi:unnamed protein product [Symbiodinium sp. CCMP2592]|nr:unnamed protein product [Symbiodinium sp. CCMP2592]
MAKGHAVAKKPAARRKTGRGPADTLAGPSWKAWVSHLKSVGPTWLYALTCLSHLLCVRVTEACMLRRSDVDLEGRTVHVGALKRGAALKKPLSNAAFKLLSEWQEAGGVSVHRTRRWGSRGAVTYKDEWEFPATDEAYLFPSKRKDSAKDRRTKDTVSKAIRKARETFVPPPNTDVKIASIRSHSARHRCCNDLKSSMVPSELGKKFARISSDKVWAGYGKLTDQQLASGMARQHEVQQVWSEIYASDQAP